MELSVQDRLILLTVLPKEGDFTTLKILRDLQSALSFKEEELAVLNFRTVESQGGTQWSQEGADQLAHVDINVGGKANSMIVAAFQELSKQKKLTIEHLPTFEKFVTD